MNCEICGANTYLSVSEWTRVCCVCGLWQSSLQPNIESSGRALCEEARAKGLSGVRRLNFEAALDCAALFMELKGSYLLDVGCAYGWFIEAAQQRGAVVLGIEPDKQMAAIARSRGLRVIEGYFPQCLNGDESFDIIAFNDVFEHIPNMHSMIAACRSRLRENGLVVLNIPTSKGILFFLAKCLAKLGWYLPWNRLWQKGFPSPHLYYFNAENIDRALKLHAFHRIHIEGTETFHPKGLWSRLRFDRPNKLVLNCLMHVALVFGRPLYKLMRRPDTVLLIYRKGLCAEQ